MPTAPSTPPPSPPATLDDVRRIYRRACLLRARGDAAGAAALQAGELETALAGLPAQATDQVRLEELKATEEARLAEAEALAELLGPLLLRQLACRPEQAPPPETRSPFIARPASGRSRPASVADFIDEMLAAEATPRAAR